MRTERITSVKHPLYAQAMELYRNSFPPHEQREAASQERILHDNAYHFTAVYDGDVFVGSVLYWETEEYLYIEHFCILPDLRNRRYGQRTLELLAACGKTLILEIDPPTNEIARRRKAFYECCGFAENPVPHVHPPYHAETRGHALVIMTYPAPISREQYDGFYCCLTGHVMKEVF